jgi:soluble lytic murein transglycosylase
MNRDGLQRAIATRPPPKRQPRPRGAGTRRSKRRRRRNALLLLVSVALVAGIGIAVVKPVVEEAIREITLPLKHEDIIRQQAREKDLDPALVAAVIYRESKFRDQTSKAGAKGLMQILPDTAKFIAHRTGGTQFELRDLANPQINISYGCWYLRYLIQRYGGNQLAAVAAYNAGHQNVDRWGGSGLKIDDIQYPETKQYARDVFDKRGDYAKHYRSQLGL